MSAFFERIKKINILNIINVIALIALIVLFASMQSTFLSVINIQNLLTDMSTLAILAAGLTFILLMGSMDLSIGAVVSISAVIFVVLLPRIGWPAYIITILFGAGAGFTNGLIFTKLRIPSFIATLGTMNIWLSIALIVSGGSPLPIASENWGFINWTKGFMLEIIPPFFVVAVGVILVLVFIQKKTKTGRYSYAIGANEKAAIVAGINIPKTKMLLFMACGICAGVTGALLAAKIRSSNPYIGDPLTLMTFAAVALGGTSLSGGKGKVIGALLGAAIVTVIKNGMVVIGVDAYLQDVVFGIIIILSILLTTDRRNKDMIVK